MPASDTVIGIVGAAALVAVMVGVFLYEYNNVEDDGATPNDAFAGLSAEGDIDGDGIPNGEDSDADGDGIPDVDDDEAAVSTGGSGTIGPRIEPASTTMGFTALTAEEGIRMVHAEVTLDPSSPDPSGTTSGFQVTLEDGEGTVLAQGTDSASVTLSSEEVLPGEIRVVIRPVQGGLGGDWEATLTAHY